MSSGPREDRAISGPTHVQVGRKRDWAARWTLAWPSWASAFDALDVVARGASRTLTAGRHGDALLRRPVSGRVSSLFQVTRIFVFFWSPSPTSVSSPCKSSSVFRCCSDCPLLCLRVQDVWRSRLKPFSSAPDVGRLRLCFGPSFVILPFNGSDSMGWSTSSARLGHKARSSSLRTLSWSFNQLLQCSPRTPSSPPQYRIFLHPGLVHCLYPPLHSLKSAPKATHHLRHYLQPPAPWPAALTASTTTRVHRTGCGCAECASLRYAAGGSCSASATPARTQSMPRIVRTARLHRGCKLLALLCGVSAPQARRAVRLLVFGRSIVLRGTGAGPTSNVASWNKHGWDLCLSI